MGPDESTPSPPAKEPENPGQGLVAPDGQPQSELVLKQLHEVQTNPAAAKDLEQREGISRSDIEQFARKYEKPKSAPPGPGREIKVKPGEQTPTKPAADLPALDGSTRFSTKNVRDRGTSAQDDVHNNLEDVRYKLPTELRGRFQAYSNRLSKVAAPKTTGKASSKSGE